MSTFLLYIIKSSCFLVLFYLGYKTLLSHETCFRFNRKVLLGGMIFCFLLPLVQVETATPGIIQRPFMELERMITGEESASLPTQAATENITSVVIKPGKIFLPYLSLVLYLTGCGVTCFLLTRSFISLFLLIQSGIKIRTGRYVLVLLNESVPPFNWWKYIILSERDYQTTPDEILTHELVHYRKHHSLDLAFAECVILLHWFNPAAWLLKRELQDIHEYEADTEVLKSGIDATKYQLLLVKKAVGSSSYTFANSFNQSKLKKRITMMCKDQSNKWARWKIMLLIPVAAYTVYAFARPDVNRQFQQLIPSESTTIPQDNKQFVPDFFDREMSVFLEKVTEKDTMGWLKEHTNIAPLLVNSRGDILYCNEYTTMQQLPSKLSNTIQKEYPNKKPVLISYQYDRGAPAATVEDIKQLVYEAFRTNKMDRKVYFYKVIPVGLFQCSSEPITLTFFTGDIQKATISFYPTTSVQKLPQNVIDIPLDEITLVQIKAPKSTQMGTITDIKNMLREASKGDMYGVKVLQELAD